MNPANARWTSAQPAGHHERVAPYRSQPPCLAWVLLVDDSRAFRVAARELLECRGYLIAAEAECAAGALEAARHLMPDSALIDVHLPDLTGFELTACLVRAYPTLPVLLTSSDADDSFYARAEACGATGFVPKSRLARVELAGFWPPRSGPQPQEFTQIG